MGSKDNDFYAVRASDKQGFELIKYELDSKDIIN